MRYLYSTRYCTGTVASRASKVKLVRALHAACRAWARVTGQCGFRARNLVDSVRCQCNAAMHSALESQSANGLGSIRPRRAQIVMCADVRVRTVTGKPGEPAWIGSGDESPRQSSIGPPSLSIPCLVDFSSLQGSVRWTCRRDGWRSVLQPVRYTQSDPVLICV